MISSILGIKYLFLMVLLFKALQEMCIYIVLSFLTRAIKDANKLELGNMKLISRIYFIISLFPYLYPLR